MLIISSHCFVKNLIKETNSFLNNVYLNRLIEDSLYYHLSNLPKMCDKLQCLNVAIYTKKNKSKKRSLLN